MLAQASDLSKHVALSPRLSLLYFRANTLRAFARVCVWGGGVACVRV